MNERYGIRHLEKSVVKKRELFGWSFFWKAVF
jgi:hypothetical protein